MQRCRNCGGTDFYTKDGAAGGLGGYGADPLPIGGWWSSNFGSAWSPRKLQSVVCGTCGLMEWLVPQHLAKVKETYPRPGKPAE
jgi:hypothetical protein